jgi:hypothetical protein
VCRPAFQALRAGGRGGNSGAPATDQRGVARGKVVDIGAFQLSADFGGLALALAGGKVVDTQETGDGIAGQPQPLADLRFRQPLLQELPGVVAEPAGRAFPAKAQPDSINLGLSEDPRREVPWGMSGPVFSETVC